jgi:hypothetical protein
LKYYDVKIYKNFLPKILWLQNGLLKLPYSFE